MDLPQKGSAWVFDNQDVHVIDVRKKGRGYYVAYGANGEPKRVALKVWKKRAKAA